MNSLLKLMVFFGIIIVPITLDAQEKEKISLDFTASIGPSILVSKLPGTDHQASTFTQTNLFVNIPLIEAFFISTGFGYELSKHVVDGSYIKTGSQYTYERTPPNYTQNEIVLDYLNFPILLKKNFGSKISQYNLGIGPVFSYLNTAKQRAKVSGERLVSDMPLENEFRYGINLDFDYKRKSTSSKVGGILGGGLFYQMSNNLSGAKSFRPISVYIRFGFGM